MEKYLPKQTEIPSLNNDKVQNNAILNVIRYVHRIIPNRMMNYAEEQLNKIGRSIAETRVTFIYCVYRKETTSFKLRHTYVYAYLFFFLYRNQKNRISCGIDKISHDIFKTQKSYSYYNTRIILEKSCRTIYLYNFVEFLKFVLPTQRASTRTHTHARANYTNIINS